MVWVIVAIAGAGITGAGGPALAADDYARAESRKPLALDLCGADAPLRHSAGCQSGVLQRLGADVTGAATTAIAAARPQTAPLVKRDQRWFLDMIEALAGNTGTDYDDAPEFSDPIVARLEQRAAALAAIAAGFGRDGVAGKWVNAFGTVELAATAEGAVRATLSTSSAYGPGSNRRFACKSFSLLRPMPDGWLAGAAATEADAEPASGGKKATIRVKRQGETLRVIAGDASRDDLDTAGLGCTGINQITGSYFAAASSDKAAPPDIDAPSFDCARPATADAEDICADPELAANDRRLNRAWRQLLPRIDTATRKLLTADQRGYVRSQAIQFPEFLHPAWEKSASDIHHTAYGRDQLFRLQLERIAVLEGFDETRRGLVGLWVAHDAALTVKPDGGRLTVAGRKWFQGDWKAGCDYAFSGTPTGDRMTSNERRSNPDTLERDHGSLIVNSRDDRFARRRYRDDGTPNDQADAPKCSRNGSVSSTVRLFPVKPSPDIGNLGGSIR